MVRTYNPSTWEAESEGLYWVQDKLGYDEFQDSQDHYEFQAILGCSVRLYVKKVLEINLRL